MLFGCVMVKLFYCVTIGDVGSEENLLYLSSSRSINCFLSSVRRTVTLYFSRTSQPLEAFTLTYEFTATLHNNFLNVTSALYVP
jgi:hypothetical protein